MKLLYKIFLYLSIPVLQIFGNIITKNGNKGLPTVDPGLFVISGVGTCGNGEGYCLLGLDCTLDKDFLPDDQNGHCEGLKSAFTPSAHFVCCKDTNTTTTIINNIHHNHNNYNKTKPIVNLPEIPKLQEEKINIPKFSTNANQNKENEIIKSVLNKITELGDSLQRNDTTRLQSYNDESLFQGVTHKYEHGSDDGDDDDDIKREKVNESNTESMEVTTDNKSIENMYSKESYNKSIEEFKLGTIVDHSETEHEASPNENIIENFNQMVSLKSDETYDKNSEEKIKWNDNVKLLTFSNHGGNIETEHNNDENNFKTNMNNNGIVSINPPISEDTENDNENYEKNEKGQSFHHVQKENENFQNKINFNTSTENEITGTVGTNQEAGHLPVNMSPLPVDNRFDSNVKTENTYRYTTVEPVATNSDTINNIKSDIINIKYEKTSTPQRPEKAKHPDDRFPPSKATSTTEEPLMYSTTSETISDSTIPNDQDEKERQCGLSAGCIALVKFMYTDKLLCYGNPLRNDWIITSASCALRIFRAGMFNVSVFPEEENEVWSASSARVRTIIIHENYRATENELHLEVNNIGVVRIYPGVSWDLCRACLPNDFQQFEGKRCATHLTTEASSVHHFRLRHNDYKNYGSGGLCEGSTELLPGSGEFLTLTCKTSTWTPRAIPNSSTNLGLPLRCDGILAGVQAAEGIGTRIYSPVSSYLDWIDENTKSRSGPTQTFRRLE